MMCFYFPAELIKMIEIGENPGGGGMGVVLYEIATCELAFKDRTSGRDPWRHPAWNAET
jgi:hypothetical protein